MKSEFQARPIYLSRKDRITAHFITCFTALILYRILEKKLGEKYTTESIIRTLKEMNMLIAPGEGYIPEYTSKRKQELINGVITPFMGS